MHQDFLDFILECAEGYLSVWKGHMKAGNAAESRQVYGFEDMIWKAAESSVGRALGRQSWRYMRAFAVYHEERKKYSHA